MKKVKNIVWALASFIVLASCTDESQDWSDAAWSTVDSKILYAPFSSQQYSSYFGGKRMSNLVLTDNKLNNTLEVWYKATTTDSTRVMHRELQLQRNQVINLIQLSETDDMDIFEFPAAPDVNTKMKTQLFYDNANQPASVKVTVLAVDRYQFQVQAQSNFNSPNLTLKAEVAQFTLNRNELSQPFDLNLNQFNGGTNNYEAQFHYKIENITTGALIQDYNRNVKIAVDNLASSGENRFKAKYKYTLSKFGTSGTYPFNTPGMLVNQAW